MCSSDLPVPILADGTLDRETLSSLLADPRSKILSLCQVSNVLGTVNPIDEIVREASSMGVKVVVDGAQSIAHFPLNLSQMGCDCFVFSGHKVFGPMGIGVVYVKSALMQEMIPYQGGGDMIDRVSFSGTSFTTGNRRFEAGTPNVAGAVGLGAAIRYLQTIDFAEAHHHESSLLRLTRAELQKIAGLTEHGTSPGKAGVFAFSIEGIHPHDIATLLDAEGIANRTGHHCCQPLMERLGVEATARASFSLYNTEEDVNRFCNALRKAVALLA